MFKDGAEEFVGLNWILNGSKWSTMITVYLIISKLAVNTCAVTKPAATVSYIFTLIRST